MTCCCSSSAFAVAEEPQFVYTLVCLEIYLPAHRYSRAPQPQNRMLNWHLSDAGAPWAFCLGHTSLFLVSDVRARGSDRDGARTHTHANVNADEYVVVLLVREHTAFNRRGKSDLSCEGALYGDLTQPYRVRRTQTAKIYVRNQINMIRKKPGGVRTSNTRPIAIGENKTNWG